MNRNAAANGLQLLCEALEDREREIAENPTFESSVSWSDLDMDDATQLYDSLISTQFLMIAFHQK